MVSAVIWGYTLLSVFLVSVLSFVGVLTLAVRAEKLEKFLLYMVSFSAGALFGDAFIHLLPEIVEQVGFGLRISLYVLLGIILSFIIEKIIRWRHHHHHLCAHPHHHKHAHPFALMNLFGDGLHNFIDGLIIGASYLVSTPVGIATTIAVVAHEIPQEFGDFGVLLQGGFTKGRALFFNFMSALTAVLGAIVALTLSTYVANITVLLIPLAAGAFIYIAGSDLIPELHKESDANGSLWQVITFILGVAVMVALLYI